MLILVMAESTSVADVIIWSSPAVFGFALYLAHDAYKSIKEDVKELKDRQVQTRNEAYKIGIDVKALGDSVAKAQRGIDANSETTKKLVFETQELTHFMSAVEKRLEVSEENYGKVIMVLKKVISILRPSVPKDPKQGR